MSENKSDLYSGLIAKAEKFSANTDIPKTVAVLGAGAMGMGIASALAEKAAINVNLYDIDVGQFKLAEDIPLIKGTTDLSEAVESADLVIEAVPEVISLKRDLICKCGVYKVVATNTSTF